MNEKKKNPQRLIKVGIVVFILCFSMLFPLLLYEDSGTVRSAIFGETGTGTNPQNMQGDIWGSPAQPSSSGTADNITVYMKQDYLYDTRCALYYYNGTRNFYTQTENRSINTSGSFEWVVFNLSDETIDPNAKYIICIWSDGGAVYMDSAGAVFLRYNAPGYGDGNFSNVTPLPESANFSYVMCAYVSYTESGGGWSNTVPVNSNPVPANGSTGVSIGLSQLNITVADVDDANQSMNITFRTNASGTWKDMQTNISVSNGTYYNLNMTEFDSYNTKYWWSVNTSDNHSTKAWDNDTYFFTTESNNTPPNVILNFAGNLSDSGGPYWRPPGETTSLSGVFSDGYYANSSKQHEDWIYVNVTANDSESTVTDVWLNWYNVTGGIWTNWTYAFVNTVGEYWEYNTSGNIQTCEGYNYSFNIVANSTGGTNTIWWNKTGIDGSIVRRCIQLNCTQVDMNYTVLYCSDAEYTSDDTNLNWGEDRLHHDQGPDGTITDTGYLTSNILNDSVHFRWCSSFVGYWYDETTCNLPFTLNSIYYHIWWSSDTNSMEIGWDKSREKIIGLPDDYYTTDSAQGKSAITYDNGEASVSNSYYLSTNLLSTTSTDFTDNNVYELYVNMVELSDYPSVISNRSFTSFIIPNVPDDIWDGTDNSTDTDSDGISDHMELNTSYGTYTNPFLADTDNDGINDYYENLAGSDPNDWTESFNTSWSNTAPVSSSESPTNKSTGVSISVGFWNVTINDVDGNTTTGNITCSNGNWSSWTTQTNGTRSCNLSTLSYSTNYTVWLNFTDGHIWCNETYWFVTESAPTGDTDYYVSNTGDNGAAGTSPATAWQTIGKVNTEMSNVINQGDDVYFNRGDTFTDAVLYPRLGGTSSDWMTIGAYGSGAKPIFSTMEIGIDQSVGSLGYIIIQDLDLQPTTIGIRWRAGGNTNNITFLRIDVDGTSSTGIIIDDTDHYRIENCHVSNAVGGGIAVYGGDDHVNWARNGVMLNCTGDGDADSIVYHEKNAGGWQVGPNHYIYNCTGYGAAAEDGFDITSGSNIYIKDCESYGNGNRAMGCGHDVNIVFIDNFYAHDENRGLLIPSGHNITTRYCTVEDIEGASGYMSYVSNEGTDAAWDSNDIFYYNNNFIFYDGSLQNYIHNGWGNVNGVTYKNNIFQSIYNSAPNLFFDVQAGTVAGNDANFTNNLWWRGDGLTGSHWGDDGGPYNWAQWTAKSEVYGSIRDDAEFADGAGGVYTLNDTSPCIDAGDWLTTTNGGGGPSTTITVHAANYFFPGFPTITHYDVPGDNIFIGDDTNLEVIAVDYVGETITVNRSITWSNGDAVSLSSYLGSAPDIGAMEFDGNAAPTITGEIPSNSAIHVSLQPTCNVTVNDTDLDTMNVTFASNYTSVWVNYQTNSTVSSDSVVRWDFTGANSDETTYWWRVYCNDGSTNISETYTFSTNYYPVNSNPVPNNGATGVSMNPNLQITISDPDSDTMNQTFRTNASGTWQDIAWNNNTAGTSLSNITTVFGNYSTKYWWSSNVSDGNGGWGNNTYHFTTISGYNAAPVLSGEIPDNGTWGVYVNLAIWSVNISDQDGDNFNWTIECSNGDTSSSNEESNGTKNLSITSLSYATTYTVYVNATDTNGTGNWTREWFTFRTSTRWYNMGTRHNIKRNICRDSNGDLHRVITWDDGPDFQIFYENSTDDGVSWNRTYITNWTSYDNAHPAILVDGSDNLHVVWQGKYAGATEDQIRYTMYNYTTGNWSSITNLTTNTSLSQITPSIVLDSNGIIHMVWRGNYSGNALYQVRYMNKTGGSWGAITNITDDTIAQQLPMIDVDSNDNLHVSWYNDSDNQQVRYTNKSSNWAIQELTSDAYDQRQPVLIVDNNDTIHVFWQGMHDGSPTVWQLRHMFYNGSWSAIENITNTPNLSIRPSVSIDNSGMIHITFYGKFPAAGDIYQIRYINNSGGSWSNPINITNTSGNDFYPNMIHARYPTSGGVPLGIPETGFAFIWADDFNDEWSYYNSSDLVWQTASWSNTAPVNSNPIYNNTVDVSLSLSQLNITVADINSNQSMTIVWRTNASGTWKDMQTNSSVPNGTYLNLNVSEFTLYSTKYWWSTNTSDNHSTPLWDNDTFFFTTRGQYIPDPPSSFTATAYNRTQINLTWTNAGVNKTCIEWNTSENWPRGNGSILYNNTGTSYQHSSLSFNTQYFYQACSWNITDSCYSVSNVSVNATTNSNNLPWGANENPANGSTASITPRCNITAIDNDTDTMTVSFYENTTDVWILQQTNNSIGNNTNVTWDYNNASSYSTTYWWCINISDGYEYINNTFNFTTIPYTNNAPVLSSAVPTNGSTGISLQPTCNITVTDVEDNMTVYFYNSTDGVVWNLNQTNTSVTTGTSVSFEYTQADTNAVDYWWKVAVNDSVNNVTAVYNFTTKPADIPIIVNPTPASGTTTTSRSVIWSVDIYDNTSFNWTIECNGLNSNGSMDTNGTFYLNMTGLPLGAYIVYVNATNGLQSLSRWFLFTVGLPAIPGKGGIRTRKVFFSSWTKDGRATILYVFSGDVVRDLTGYKTIIVVCDNPIEKLRYFLESGCLR